MPFTALTFLTLFLPCVCIVYYLVPRAGRNAVALAASLVFYAWGAPAFLPVILALGVIDYHLAHGIAKASTLRLKKLLLGSGICVHLGVLCYFKYSNFFVGQTNTLLAHFHIAPIPWASVALPIGVSFLTFEEISCLCDVYRGDAKPAKNVFRYLLFLMLFPHSIAGPIFRWKDIEAQLDQRTLSLARASYGIRRFCFGLAKKVLIANMVAIAVDPIFALPAAQLTPLLTWLGVVCYALQIYFDFSGYSDMAVGLGHLLGFTFKENFNDPYCSESITEFWRRWHISLSTWLRDYLYRPLGGNRGSAARTRLNVMIVFGLSGLWHGANWTFGIWGIYHGLLTVAERTNAVARLRAAMPRPVNIVSTMVLVLVGWVFFRAHSIGFALHYIAAMFGAAGAKALPGVLPGILTHRVLVAMAAGVLLCVFPLVQGLRPAGRENHGRTPTEGPSFALAVSGAAALACFAFSFIYLCNSRFNPLIYFKF
jgi:alginate O-acetyltransferase complex protein AlgI